MLWGVVPGLGPFIQFLAAQTISDKIGAIQQQLVNLQFGQVGGAQVRGGPGCLAASLLPRQFLLAGADPPSKLVLVYSNLDVVTDGIVAWYGPDNECLPIGGF